MVSCATIKNTTESITLYTSEPSRIVYKQDTIKTVNNEAHLTVERKREKLLIIAMTDSLTKSIEIKPKNSFVYWTNIYFDYFPFGITDIFWGKNIPQQSIYPEKIYINSADTKNKFYRYKPSEYYRANLSDNKGELHLHLSLPHINSFRMMPQNEGVKINTGFWGFTIGLDYYHSNNQFINIGFSGVLDFFVPVPAAVDISGEYEAMNSVYISLSNNHKLGRFRRFKTGYGISYARNTWSFNYSNRFNPPPPTRDPVKKSHNTLGFIIPTYFQIGNNFNIGIVYRPTFYSPNMTDKIFYEHLISIDFAWKLRLNR